jgi:tyrosinase
VHSGPFVNYTVNLGSILDPDPTRYNPRCLKRDLNPYVCSHWASLRNATQLILDSPNIELFQAIMQGDARYPEAANLFFGVHGGGHYSMSKCLPQSSDKF